MSTPFSDDDLQAAIEAGALTPEAAEGFRQFVAARRATPLADEESFRLLTGFNDIFIAIAILLSLSALAWLSGDLLGPNRSAGWASSAATVAIASWALAEFFTRRRRMALPSILLLIAFVGAVSGVVFTMVADGHAVSSVAGSLRLAAVGAGGAAAAWVHWLRFRVPITVAAGAVTGGLALVVAIEGATNSLDVGRIAMIVVGATIFALAMWWDLGDRERKTRRADVAFWLHLAAAPMIVHPVFGALGYVGASALAFGAAPTASDSQVEHALIACALYLGLTLVALIVDRRALMVSALAYMLYAMNELLRSAGALGASFALTALVAGAALLLLGAFWSAARRLTLRPLPAAWRARLPPG